MTCDYCAYRNSWYCENGWNRCKNCDRFKLDWDGLSDKDKKIFRKYWMEGVINMEKYWIYDGTDLGIACPCCKKSFQSYIHFTEDGSLIEIPNYCPNCGERLLYKYE